MRGHTVLQVAADLRISIDGPVSTWVQCAQGPPLQCGRYSLALLDQFRTPRTVQEAIDRLTPQLVSTASVAEVMATLVTLRRAGFLVPPGCPAAAASGATGFSAPAIHIAMLNDRARTDALLRAVREHVKPGDVVVDLGTGTGVLAVAAAQAGARRVYAMEAGAMADVAAKVFAANGVADRIVLVRRWSTDAVIEERADVLVTETIGSDPWEEGLLNLISDARKRFLKPDARLIPSRIRWFAQPLVVPAADQQSMGFSAVTCEQWTDWYGIDFGPLLTAQAGAQATTRLPRGLGGWPRPCPPILLAEVDLASGASLAATVTGRATATDDGVIDGVALFWEADLSPGVRLSTEPGPWAPTSWRLPLLLVSPACPVRKGQTLSIDVLRGPAPRVQFAVEPAAAAR